MIDAQDHTAREQEDIQDHAHESEDLAVTGAKQRRDPEHDARQFHERRDHQKDGDEKQQRRIAGRIRSG